MLRHSSAPRDFDPRASGVHPAPLRARALPRALVRVDAGPVRIPERREARGAAASLLNFLAAELGVTNAELGEHFGTETTGEKAASQLRSGAGVVTAGEAASLFPLRLASAFLLDLIAARVQRELVADVPGELRLRLTLALTHIQATRALLVGDPEHQE